jgi:hypothetical protein
MKPDETQMKPNETKMKPSETNKIKMKHVTK